jgi:hypothetical protein
MWTCNLYQTTTGLIGPRLDPEEFSWGIELNGTESWSLTLKKSSLPKVDFNYWLAPWWVGVVFFYDGIPIVAGPLMNLPSESFSEIQLAGAGIRSILARRKVTHEIFGTDWTSMPTLNVGWSGLSLGTISKRVVQQAQMKKGGSLPISYPIPDETGINERNYRGFNIQNNSADAVLTKLSNVRSGPDILFKPRLVDPNRLTFDFWTGTKNSARIRQFSNPSWDITPEKSYTSNVRLTTTGAYQTFRVYSTGAGMDAGIKMDVVTNDDPLAKGFPLLETSIGTSKSEDLAVVRAHGMANLSMNTNVLQEIELHVRADGINKLGTFWPGDLVQVNIKNFITLEDKFHSMRLLAISGNSSNDVMMNLQSESKFLSTQESESETEEDVP